MTPVEFNTLYLRRLESAGVLAPGSANFFIKTGEVRGELRQEPPAFVGEMVKFLLSDDGKRHLSESSEKAMARGVGLSRIRPLIDPLLSYHDGRKFADSMAADLDAYEPETAASAVVRKLLYDRDARDAAHQDFRPELPYGEVQVAKVLSRLADQGVRVTDPDGLAREWSKAGAPGNGGFAGTARAIIGRLANHESHRLSPGSKKPPVFDERDWGERNEAAEAEVRKTHAAYI